MKFVYKALLISLCFFRVLLASGQEISLKGQIIDETTREPLAFVYITLKGTQNGTTSDIDGRWKLEHLSANNILVFSYVGYQGFTLPASDFNVKYPTGLVKLHKSTYDLKEVKVIAGENPAHRILKKVLANKPKNNWERLNTFAFTSYNKFIVSREVPDSAALALLKRNQQKSGVKVTVESHPQRDSSKMTMKQQDSIRKSDSLDKYETDSFFDAQHLFLVESVAEKKFKYPDKIKEKIIASKTSGFKDLRFSLISTEFNNFNIYKDYIEVGKKQYFSPIAYGSLKKYFYILEDSIINETDTVYIISYRPRRGTLFNGFHGLLYINTHKYAVQNVIARPMEVDGAFNTQIQQQFKYIENHTWFPTQIISSIYFSNIGGSTYLVGKGRSYFKDILLKPELKNREFNSVQVEIDARANQKSDTFWSKARTDTFTIKDQNTYRVIDSVSKSVNLEKKLVLAEAVLSGRLPLGPVDLYLGRIISYNLYEGFRFGAGLATNDKISKYFKVGGYAGYGIKDKKWKYGGLFNITPIPGRRLNIGGGYINDVQEFGGVKWSMDRRPHYSEPERFWNLGKMYNFTTSYGFVEFTPFRYLSLKPMYRISRECARDYYFSSDNSNPKNIFNFEEASIGIRYAYKEKFIQSPGSLISLGTDYPILYATISKGMNNFLQDGYEFDKVDVKIEKSFRIKLAGHSRIQVRGGYLDGKLPLFRLYNGNGNLGPLRVAAENTFETMPVYDYFTNRYAAIFYMHSFEKLLIKARHFRPVIRVFSSAIIGDIQSDRKGSDNLTYKTLNKGYFESGLALENIIKSQFLGTGIGVFYHYGSYASSDWRKNCVIKLTISSKLFGD